MSLHVANACRSNVLNIRWYFYEGDIREDSFQDEAAIDDKFLTVPDEGGVPYTTGTYSKFHGKNKWIITHYVLIRVKP